MIRQERKLKQHREALLACAEELSSLLGLHGDETESAKLERSAALRNAKKILGKALVLGGARKPD